jgi:acetyltransferase-like isoleucine patch superfamily enzyme
LPSILNRTKNFNHNSSSTQHNLTNTKYNSFEPSLNEARFKARAFAHKFNTWFPDASTNPSEGFDILASERLKMLKRIIGHVGDDNIFIEPPFNIDYGCNISLGERFYANFNLTILDCSLVTIGNRCMFGPNVSIFAATHEAEVQSRRDNIEYGRPVVIGDDCWIGGNVVSSYYRRCIKKRLTHVGDLARRDNWAGLYDWSHECR